MDQDKDNLQSTETKLPIRGQCNQLSRAQAWYQLREESANHDHYISYKHKLAKYTHKLVPRNL